MRLTYKQAQERMTSLISEMEESMVELFREKGVERLDLSKACIDGVIPADYANANDFRLEFVELGDENNIILRGYDSDDYGYFTDQNWNVIQLVYYAVGLAEHKL